MLGFSVGHTENEKHQHIEASYETGSFKRVIQSFMALPKNTLKLICEIRSSRIR